MGVGGGEVGEFGEGDAADSGEGAEDEGEVGGGVEEGAVLAEDEGLAADGKHVGGVGLDKESVEGDGGGQAGKGLGGGGEEGAADAEPDIGAAQDGMAEEIGGEGDAVKEDGGEPICPGFQKTEERTPGTGAMKDDGAAEAGGEGELGLESIALGGTTIERFADAVKTDFPNEGAWVCAEGAFKEVGPVRTGGGDTPGMEAEGSGDVEGAMDFGVPIFGTGSTVDTTGDAEVDGLFDKASVIGDDARVAEVEVGVKHRNQGQKTLGAGSRRIASAVGRV